jgi:hypothetical protein
MLDDDRPALTGMNLRYLLTVVLLDAGRPLTTAELVEAVRSSGRDIAGRASKTVSDALRWEIRKGRVVRLGRSVYRCGSMPRSTQWWIRRRVRQLVLRDELEAAW